MHKLSCAILLFLISGFYYNLQSQTNHILEIEIAGYEQPTIMWASLYGDEINILDTIHRNDGKYAYSIPSGTPSGVYRLVLDQRKKYLDVVFQDQDIKLKTNYIAVLDGLEIMDADATLRYHRFMRSRGYVSYKRKVLEDFLYGFPEQDAFYAEAFQKFLSLDQEMNDTIGNLLAAPDDFLNRILRNERVSISHEIRNIEDYFQYYQAHFFDQKDFSSPDILRSTLMPDYLLNYLSFFRNEQYTKEQQEVAFLPAIDSIFSHTRANPEVFDYVVNYLLEGFKRFGFDRLVQHIAELTKAELSCINEDRRREMEEKIHRIEATAQGVVAPQILMKDINGDDFDLHDAEAKKTLVVFWASWCPHCMEMLPQLKAYLQDDDSDLLVVAVSLDTDTKAWKEAAENYPWKHVSALAGWDTQAVDDYFVYGTPAFFLLDKDKKILKKSGTLQEMLPELRKD